MFEVVFLGTAAGVPSTDRGLPALIVLHRRRRFLVDCGEGTQRQLLRSGLGLRRLDHVLLTHAHVDHLLGIGGLVATLALLDAGHSLAVFAGASALRAVRGLLTEVIWPGGRPEFQVRYVAIETGTIIEDDHLRVGAFPVTHRGEGCFGFVFEEKARPRLLPDRLAAFKVPLGPVRRRLLEGEEVVLPDGRRIAPDDVVAAPRRGSRLVVIGDAGSVDELLEVVQDADALIIEATFLERDADKAAQRAHLTAAQAARLARTANVGALYLTHLSGRYEQAEVEAEARAVFPAARVARDFDRITVRAP
ncbi:MAG TPA: ribonuclease Z [Alphaproteobacteria bacterium]|nr:ribonuclease Z [Alphaproteobacteria bacterium]